MHNYTGDNGLFSSVVPSRSAKSTIIGMLHDNELNVDIVPNLHCTIMYSRKAIGVDDALNFEHKDFRALPQKITWWEGHDKVGYLVLLLQSVEMEHEHYRLRRLGCEPTFDDYQPHVTLVTPFAKTLAKSLQYNIGVVNNYIRRNGDYLMFGNQTVEDLRE